MKIIKRTIIVCG